MFKSKRDFILGFLCCFLMMSLAFNVFAAPIERTITAVYNDIKIYIDEVLLSLRDVNGDTVEPFIYNGTTYVPVRAIAQAFGKYVDWDGETNSVYIRTKPVEAEQAVNNIPAQSSDVRLTGRYILIKMEINEDEENEYFNLDDLKAMYELFEMEWIDSYIEFFDDNKFRVSFFDEVEEGTYTIDGKTIKFYIEGDVEEGMINEDRTRITFIDDEIILVFEKK